MLWVPCRGQGMRGLDGLFPGKPSARWAVPQLPGDERLCVPWLLVVPLESLACKLTSVLQSLSIEMIRIHIKRSHDIIKLITFGWIFPKDLTCPLELLLHHHLPSWTPSGWSRSVRQGLTGALKVFWHQIRCHSTSSPTDDRIGLCGAHCASSEVHAMSRPLTIDTAS